MTLLDLSDASLKLERARKHIADIDTAIADLAASDGYRLIFNYDQGEGFVQVELQSLHEVDKSINAVIGDAVGNLRSSLDYIIGAVVKPLGGDSEKVTFPFADTKKGFEGEVRSPNLCLTDALITQFHELEAYQGGAGHRLWAINKLRNIDKHRLLITVNQIAGIEADWQVGTMIFRKCGFGIEAGKKGSGIKAPAKDFKFTSEPRPIFKMRFDEPAHAINDDAATLLHGCAGDIESLIDALKKI